MREEITWTVDVAGVPLNCTYWPGPANTTVIRVSVPLAHPETVSGEDCYPYVNGVRQSVRYLKDYDDGTYEVPGGQPHPGVTPFEVTWGGERVYGKPVNSPHTIQDANLDALCIYDHYYTWQSDDGYEHTSGPFTVFRKEVSRAIHASLQPFLEQSGDLKTRALVTLQEVPAGVAKEDYLPFVEAMCRYLDAEQGAALDADDTARSFTLANEQIQYRRDYERLTGRPWI